MGSIQKIKGKSGHSYKIKYDVYIDGVRKQKSQSFKGISEPEAKRILREKETALYNGIEVDPGKITLGQYLDKWLESHKKSIEKYSIQSYKERIKVIKPLLGFIQLRKLTRLHVQEFVDKLLYDVEVRGKKGYAPKSVLNAHRVLHKCLENAVKMDLISRNPSDYIELPKCKNVEVQNILSKDDINYFLKTIEGSDLYLPVFLAVYTGMRLGEILALSWKDIDFNKKAIKVRQAVYAVQGEKGFKKPKSDKGSRIIEVSDNVIVFLKELKNKQKKDRAVVALFKDNDLLYCCSDGSPKRPTTVSQLLIRKAEKAGIKVTFRGLRHTHATLLLELDEHPKVVQERLGHSTIGTTLDIYTHVMPGMQKRAADKLEELLL